MIGSKIGHVLDPLILKVVRCIFRKDTNPNSVTVAGFLIALVAAWVIGAGYLIAGGVILLLSGFMDLADGALARSAGKVTPFGGFLDSVLDRYSDLLPLLGVFVYLIRSGEITGAFLIFVASVGGAVIPYARARAEAAGFSCTTGILERPERTILLLIGLFFNVLVYVAGVLAVLTHVTVAQRIFYVRRQSRR